MNEWFYIWYITISGCISILMIAFLAKVDAIFASCMGVLFFFLMMLSLFFIGFAVRIMKRKEGNEDDDRIK